MKIRNMKNMANAFFFGLLAGEICFLPITILIGNAFSVAICSTIVIVALIGLLLTLERN